MKNTDLPVPVRRESDWISLGWALPWILSPKCLRWRHYVPGSGPLEGGCTGTRSPPSVRALAMESWGGGCLHLTWESRQQLGEVSLSRVEAVATQWGHLGTL